MEPTREQLAHLIDHTLLKTDATPKQVTSLISEARELGTYSVCVSPSMLPITTDLGSLRVATVCGFPSGKHTTNIKAAEAREAVSNGADEVDMVIDIGLLKDNRPELVKAEIAAVRAVVPGILKVIIESAALTDEEIVTACQLAEQAKADFVKTSTGFHPAGGAAIKAVQLMAQTVGGRLGVKASGGIRDWSTAVAMVAAGATRLGVSATRVILNGTSTTDSY